MLEEGLGDQLDAVVWWPSGLHEMATLFQNIGGGYRKMQYIFKIPDKTHTAEAI